MAWVDKDSMLVDLVRVNEGASMAGGSERMVYLRGGAFKLERLGREGVGCWRCDEAQNVVFNAADGPLHVDRPVF